jgi:hypothetical protein
VHATELGAIPEATTPGRRSKRHAETADEVSLERAERIKTAHNLDFPQGKGTPDELLYSFLQFPNEIVSSNLSVVGISLGHDSVAVTNSIKTVKEIEEARLANR